MKNPYLSKTKKAAGLAATQEKPMFNNNYGDTSPYIQSNYSGTNETISFNSIINVSLLGVFITVVATALNTGLFFKAPSIASILSMVGLFGVLGLAIVSFFKTIDGPIGLFLYGILEGLMISGIVFYIGTYNFTNGENGWILVSQALMGTAGAFMISLLAYKSGLVKVNQRFKSILAIGTMSIFFVYLANIFTSFIFKKNFLFEPTWLALGIGAIAVVLAMMSLIDLFDTSISIVESGAPDNLKWIMGISFVVSLVWLYIEILRILFLLALRRE